MFVKSSDQITPFPEAKKSILKNIFEISPDGPLNGVMIVEIGQHVSGPMVGERLARKGACVVKIEQPKMGDPARHYLSKEIFTSLNASKLSVAIGKEDDEFYQELLSLADVIIDNRSPEAKKHDVFLNTFLQSDHKLHPVIFCSLIGYEGDDNKDLLALDVSVQATTGMTSVNGSEPNKPLKVGFVVLDEATAMEASDLIVSHLFSLSRGKKIPKQDANVISLQVSMANVAAYLMTGQYLNCLTQNKEPSRYGNRDNWLAPFSFYQTKDGMISLAVVNEEQYKRLCLDVLKNVKLYENYSTNVCRLKRADEFQTTLENILMTNTADFWLAECIQHKVPAGKVNTVMEALKQSFSKNFFTYTLNHTTVIANPYKSSLFSDITLHEAPSLDQHRKFVQVLIEEYKSIKQVNESASFQQIYAEVITGQNKMDGDVDLENTSLAISSLSSK